MKNIVTLLFVLFSFFSKSTSAQTSACNAEFNVVYQNSNTVQFNPINPGTVIGTQHYWIFGDGAVTNTVSPSHVYLNSGVYTAKHIIIFTNNGVEICRDSAFRVIQIQTACNLVASFTSTMTASNIFHFQNTSSPLNATDSITWTFGDGTSSHDVSPNHTYTQPGTYTVCLRVKQNNSPTPNICVREICHTIVVQNPVNCTLVANFTSTMVTPNTYHFENTSTPLNPSDSIHWSFGDGSNSNQVSPNHTYTQSGTYTVCLRVKQNISGSTTPCVREICHTIIVQIPTTCNLVAGFTSTMISPNTYHFENTSTPINTTDSISWTFGDGSPVSNTVSPNHTYAVSGVYVVCLRVQQRNNPGTINNCVREICQTIVVQIPATCVLVADFYFYRDTTVTSPYTYHFENTSAPLHNTDSIRWTFGDGSSSNQVSPNHTYLQPGNYTVCLRVQQRNNNGTLTSCVREICHTVVVLYPATCNLVANFTSTLVSANVYHFNNTTSNLSATDSIRWSFGDGSSSNILNPTHTYTQPGTYNVCLRVQKRNSIGTLSTCVSDICHTIVITAPCNTQAHFSWRADSLNSRKIIFTNLTVSTTATATATWSFGDGSTATGWNTVHTYTQPGRYNVCLRIEFGPNCVAYSCDSITVQTTTVSCIQQSHFSFTKSTTNSQFYHFAPLQINSNFQYTWTFGDGTGSTSITPSHLYAQPGNYTVCLTVYRNTNCASTTCRTVNVISQTNCNTAQVSYNYQADPVISNKIYFQAISNIPLSSQQWTITRLPGTATTAPVIINQNNPSYIFRDTGYYRVCLRAVTVGGCVKEYCRVIHIAHVVTPAVCTLQPYPNPSTNSISVNVTLNQPQMIDVYVYNNSNLLVKEKHQQGVSGTNTVTLAINNLVPGIYIMKLIHGNNICYAQFIKL